MRIQGVPDGFVTFRDKSDMARSRATRIPLAPVTFSRDHLHCPGDEPQSARRGHQPPVDAERAQADELLRRQPQQQRPQIDEGRREAHPAKPSFQPILSNQHRQLGGDTRQRTVRYGRGDRGHAGVGQITGGVDAGHTGFAGIVDLDDDAEECVDRGKT